MFKDIWKKIYCFVTHQLSLREDDYWFEEKIEQFELLNLPDDILLEIFRSFNDVDLLAASQVCKRFKKVAKEIVKWKYNGDTIDKYYEVYAYYQDESDIHQLYREFLETFGHQITALNLYIEQTIQLNQTLKPMNKHCRLLKHVIVRGYSFGNIPITKIIQKMPHLNSLVLEHLSCEDFAFAGHHYAQLESLSLKLVKNINVNMLKRFLTRNSQLKHLKVIDCDILKLRVLKPLKTNFNGLKSLEFVNSNNEFIMHNCNVICVGNLEYLKISVHHKTLANLLSAFHRGSKMIKKLDVIVRGCSIDHDKAHDAFEQSIGLFDELNSFKVEGLTIRNSLIEIFVRSLPNLTSLHLCDVELSEITIDTILEMFKRCQQLKEVTLESKDKNNRLNENVQFNLDFHREYAKIVGNRGATTQFKINQLDKRILITEEKIMENGEMRYWTGFDASLSRSKVHMFDLGEQVLEKIYDYLDEKSLRTLYQTCTKTKETMGERIKSQWFTVTDEKSAKDIFNQFGEDICYLTIDMNTDDHTQMVETWELISKKCSKQLIEMEINNVRVDAMDSVAVEFPNLMKLRVRSMVSCNAHIFPLMNCPKLFQLEFDQGEITVPENMPQFGITLNSLTSIRLNHFSNGINKILDHLDDETCNQLQEFTAEKIVRSEEADEIIFYYILSKPLPLKIIDLVMRFRNLVTLNLIYFLSLPPIKNLFQSFTKLKCFTLKTDEYCHEIENWRPMLKDIGENCRQIEVFQMLQSSETTFDQNLITEIINSLPNIKVKTIYFDCHTATYKVQNYENTKVELYEPY